MRQILITQAGPPSVLKVVERPEPDVSAGMVKIQVKAAGVNFADILARKGLYPDAPKLPCVVGYEVAGEVVEIGEGVDPGLENKAVIALTRFNGYSEFVVVSVNQIFLKPEKLSFEEAAAIPVNYLTAYQLLVVMGGLRKGETVLIHNAGGGVGLAALDIARHIGARTIGTASARKHEFLKQRGLDEAIDYRTENWLGRVLELTNGKGVELVIDPIGGKNWRLSYKALRATGRLGMFGVSTVTEGGAGSKLNFIPVLMQMPFYHPLGLINRNKGVFGVNMGHLWNEGEKVREWGLDILKGVEEGWVRPHVDKVFPFDQAAEAHQYIENRQNIGKVILIP